jgi:hypothetical protein
MIGQIKFFFEPYEFYFRKRVKIIYDKTYYELHQQPTNAKQIIKLSEPIY